MDEKLNEQREKFFYSNVEGYWDDPLNLYPSYELYPDDELYPRGDE